MLPSQILLNSLLYDSSRLAIPTDNVDEEQLRRPSHWDIAFIRRFMIYFGLLSSVFDFAALAGMVAGYLALVELGKRFFYRTPPTTTTRRPADRYRHLRRRAARFSTAARPPDRTAAL
jgi:magnesium-transporting ATPase (P-type)